MSWTNGARIAISLRVMGMKSAEIVAKGTTEEDEIVSCDCDLSLGEYIRETLFNFAKQAGALCANHRAGEHEDRIFQPYWVNL